MTNASEKTMAAEAELYDLFSRHGIAWTHHTHPPLFTVEESKALRGELPGAHVKNMFLKDKKGQLWLVTCLEHRQFRIRDLEKQIGATKASFGKPELLWQALGIRPGAVSAFGLINDPGHEVRVVLDQQMLDHSPINAHPLHNEATTAVSSADFLRFFEVTGHEPIIVDFDALEALEQARADAS
ncbi:prolyl-tRNA synthetase associated domain-containing protein [Rhodobacteraceae bacterium NNCM2]|nr:prolyl-tRNA synthetase associated domain-containing protein [Coraliihabitans acroporae]